MNFVGLTICSGDPAKQETKQGLGVWNPLNGLAMLRGQGALETKLGYLTHMCHPLSSLLLGS